MQGISRTFVHPKLHTACKEYVDNCDICKRMKTGHRQEGQLAPRIAIAAPVHVDCIGNWRFEVSKSVVSNLCALTMIDPITNLLEIVHLPRAAPNAETVMQAFENTWLSRYPKPMTIISDHGAEFIEHEFPQKLLEAGIRFKLVSVHNPQSNGIIEQVHRTILQIL